MEERSNRHNWKLGVEFISCWPLSILFLDAFFVPGFFTQDHMTHQSDIMIILAEKTFTGLAIAAL
jgi:hypothetical protein